MSRWLRTAVVLAMGCAALRPRPVHSQALPPEPEIFVDAAAAAGGDGSAARPFRDLPAALASGHHRIRLRGGSYPGPFELPSGTELVGEAPVVLFADGLAPATLTAAGPVSLRSIQVQGGRVGVAFGANAGQSTLDGVAWSGQRGAALQVSAGEVTVRSGQFHASVSGIPGVRVGPKARFACEACTFDGPFQRAVDSDSGEVKLSQSKFDGAVTGLQQVGGSAVLDHVDFQGGRGPAVFASHATVRLSAVTVHGQEYGLLARDQAHLEVHGFSSVRAERAGLAFVETQALLTDVRTSESGALGGVQIVGGNVTLRRFVIFDATDYGLSARQGVLTLEEGRIEEVSSSGAAGDCLHLRDLKADIQGVTLRRGSGTGLTAAEGAQVRLRDVVIEQSGVAGIQIDSQAEVTASSTAVSDTQGPAVVVPAGGTFKADALDAYRNRDGTVWAECALGARVYLSRVRTDAARVRSECVWRWESAPGQGVPSLTP